MDEAVWDASSITGFPETSSDLGAYYQLVFCSDAKFQSYGWS